MYSPFAGVCSVLKSVSRGCWSLSENVGNVQNAGRGVSPGISEGAQSRYFQNTRREGGSARSINGISYA